jgi:cytidylate kinase
MQIALDGPAGVGKSTVAKAIAKKLGIVYLDTGAMYRAVALFMLEHGIAPENIPAVEKALENVELSIKYDDGVQKIYLCGQDVSDAIRENRISAAASSFSAIPAVRVFLVQMQRRLAEKNDCVLDGRDIGTFVLPNADFKFYLTADAAERAKRRAAELEARGEPADVEKIQKEIEARDYADSHREFAPLRQAEDALLVDSTHLSAKQVTDFIINKIKEGR